MFSYTFISKLKHIIFSITMFMAFNGEIFEVFSWLSAKSIFKFTYVCKACNTFLAEDLFIKRKSQNMLSHKEFGFFIQPNSCQRYGDKLELHTLAEGEEHCCGVPPQSLEFINRTGRLLTSCNGLLCSRNINNMPTKSTTERLTCTCVKF
ncbi:hypothetical protein U1Q18_052480 [Sarracenia purpurea var. burkii]